MEKTVTYEDLKKNDGKNGNKLWVLIDGKVYDVSEYDHPGGIEVFDNNETDKLEEFEAEGHSNTAKILMKSFYVGEIEKI